MEDLVLSCLESRVEENRNLYARFLVGPFLRGDALTVATALRRVLLSSVESIGITALSIQGITHEFSTVVGVRESVLELSLNFGAIVLSYDKTFFEKKSFFDKPQIGYLQIQGPKVVYANHLKLPLGVKLVDPTQYIATVSKEGSIVLKFTIGKRNDLLHQNIGSTPHFEERAKRLSVIGEVGKKNIVTAKKLSLYKNGSTIDSFEGGERVLFPFLPSVHRRCNKKRKPTLCAISEHRALLPSRKIRKVCKTLLSYTPLSTNGNQESFASPWMPFPTPTKACALPKNKQEKSALNRCKARLAFSSHNSCPKRICQPVHNKSVPVPVPMPVPMPKGHGHGHGHQLSQEDLLGIKSSCKSLICTCNRSCQGIGAQFSGVRFAKVVKGNSKVYGALKVHTETHKKSGFGCKAKPFKRCNRGEHWIDGYPLQLSQEDLLASKTSLSFSPQRRLYKQNGASLQYQDVDDLTRGRKQHDSIVYNQSCKRKKNTLGFTSKTIRPPYWTRQEGEQLKRPREGFGTVCTPCNSLPELCSSLGVAPLEKPNKTSYRHRAKLCQKLCACMTGSEWNSTRLLCKSKFKNRAASCNKNGVESSSTERSSARSMFTSWKAASKGGSSSKKAERKRLRFLSKSNGFQSSTCLRNVIPLDVTLPPVLKVNFVIELDDEVVYLRQKIRERIILEVWTNGSIHPRQAVHDSSLRLLDMFATFRSIYQLR